MRLPFFRLRVCTVMLSAPKVRHVSNVRRKPSGVSAGSPAIRSMFTWGKPMDVASSMAFSMSSGLCFRPMAESTRGSSDWGFTLIRSAP